MEGFPGIDPQDKTGVDVATAHVISSKGCECRPDRLHFTAAGYREFGKRYAEKMLTLQTRASVPGTVRASTSASPVAAATIRE